MTQAIPIAPNPSAKSFASMVALFTTAVFITGVLLMEAVAGTASANDERQAAPPSAATEPLAPALETALRSLEKTISRNTSNDPRVQLQTHVNAIRSGAGLGKQDAARNAMSELRMSVYKLRTDRLVSATGAGRILTAAGDVEVQLSSIRPLVKPTTTTTAAPTTTTKPKPKPTTTSTTKVTPPANTTTTPTTVRTTTTTKPKPATTTTAVPLPVI